MWKLVEQEMSWDQGWRSVLKVGCGVYDHGSQVLLMLLYWIKPVPVNELSARLGHQASRGHQAKLVEN